MNSKPQQIKMQSTKKGPLTKREEGGAQAGMVAVSPAVADEAVSAGAAPAAPSSAQQPQVCNMAFSVPFQDLSLGILFNSIHV